MNLPEDIGTLIADLTRRVAALETAPRATNTSIRTGSFSVLDAASQTRVRTGVMGNGNYGVEALDAAGLARARLGQLADGTYGVELVSAAGVATSLNNAILGIAADTSGFTQITSTDPNNPTPLVSGFNVTVGPSGRVLLIATAIMQMTSTAANLAPQMTAYPLLAGLNYTGGITYRGRTTTTGQLTIASVALSRVLSGISPGVKACSMGGFQNVTPAVTDAYMSDATMIVLPL